MKRSIFAILFLLCAVTAAAIAQTPTGNPPFSSVGGGPFDQIDLSNLNVHFAIPIFHKAGRGLPFDYAMSYDSSVWTPPSVNGTSSWQPVNSNWGWRGQSEALVGYVSYHITTVLACYTYTDGGKVKIPNYMAETIYTGYSDPGGVIHGMGKVFLGGSSACNISPTAAGNYSAASTDGSGYTMNIYWSGSAGTATVYGRGGRTINPPTTPNGSGTIADSNGNQLTDNNGTSFVDTMGDTVLTISGSGTPSSPMVYTYTAP